MKYGDVVTYWEEDTLITHRIFKIEKNKIVPKGDNNNEEDQEISQNRILGKVIFCSVKLGKLITVYLKYIFIVFTIIVIFINIDSFQGREKDEREQNKAHQ